MYLNFSQIKFLCFLFLAFLLVQEFLGRQKTDIGTGQEAIQSQTTYGEDWRESYPVNKEASSKARN